MGERGLVPFVDTVADDNPFDGAPGSLPDSASRSSRRRTSVAFATASRIASESSTTSTRAPCTAAASRTFLSAA